MNKSSKNGHACLIPSCKRNAFLFFPTLNIMLAVSLFYIVFMLLRYVHSIPNCFSVFIRNGCLTWPKAFSIANEMIMWFWFLSLCNGSHLLVCMLNQPWIPGRKPVWSCCMSLVLECACESQETTFGCQFFSSSIGVPGIELRPSGLAASTLPAKPYCQTFLGLCWEFLCLCWSGLSLFVVIELALA